ncbi:hypothetical protein EMCRGX_G015387 [Ephydatia muelleri]
MPSRNQKKRSKQRAEYLQKREDILSQENKAKARARYKADPEKKKASVRDTYKADPEKKKASADPEKKKAYVRDTYKADPEKKKASVRDTYNANAASKRAAKRQRYQEGVEENRAAKRQRYQEGVEENRAAKRQRYREGLEENRAAKRRIYRGNSATIKAARRSRYWKGRRTTTTTQSYSLFEPNSRTLAEYGVKLEKAILRDSELLSEHGAIPVDLTGRCVVAEEIKDRDKVTMRPLKWKCTNECRKLTSEEVAIVLKTNSLFQKSIEDLRAGLDALDSGLLYKARKCHMTILAIDSALASGNIEELIPFMGMRDNLSDLFSEDGVEHAVVSEDHSSSGLGCIERDLKVTHADLIAELHHPEKKKASVRDSYKADPEKKKASVRDSYNADIESKQSAKRQRYQEDIEENRAAKRQKYEDNSDAIKASERNRYSLYEPKSHALMEYNGGLEKAILRDSELLSEVNDAFCKSHPLLAQKVVTRSACAAQQRCPTTPAVAVPPPAAAAAELPPPPPAVAAELPPPPPAVAAELPPPPPAVAAELPPPAEAGALLPAPAPPPAQAVLTPVPPPPLRLLLPWPLPPPPTWLPWPEPGRRGHRRGWGRHRGQGRTVPVQVARFLAGGNLVALEKNKPNCPPDIRPIAVGEAIRRLAGKCLCVIPKEKAHDFLAPLQLGVVTPAGAEKIIHGLRGCVDEHWHDADFAILKIHFPELLPWSSWCYGQHPALWHPLGTIPQK